MTLNSFKCICTSAVLLVSPYKLCACSHQTLYKEKNSRFHILTYAYALKAAAEPSFSVTGSLPSSPFDLTSPSPALPGSILFPLLLPSHLASRNKLPLPLSLQTRDDPKPFQYYSSSLIFSLKSPAPVCTPEN